MQKHWFARLRAGFMFAGVISLIPAGIGVAREKSSNPDQAQGDSSLRGERLDRSKRVSTSKTSRRVSRGRGSTHSIIFVGGKSGSRVNATKSNPRQAKKVQGELNPQPIPPGKRIRHS